MYKTKIVLLILLVSFPSVSFSNSPDSISWDVLDGGGGQMCSPDHLIAGSLGQIAPGVSSTETHMIWAGYCSGIDTLDWEATYVDLASFSATGHDGHIEIEWSTAAEVDNAGFNLHRGLSKDGPYAQINDQFIPARGSAIEGATYSFADEDVVEGVTYYYWLEDVDIHGRSSIHGPVSATPGQSSVDQRENRPIPTSFGLAPNYPNPFNPITEITYALPQDSRVKLTIYNILGQKVVTLVDELQRAGYRSARWDARSFSGGIYFYRLQAGEFLETRKMILLK